jgi:membrane peptidoglycan carboxypeptidase
MRGGPNGAPNGGPRRPGGRPVPGDIPTDLLPPVSEPEFAPEPALLTHRDDDYAFEPGPPDGGDTGMGAPIEDEADLKLLRRKKIWRRVRRTGYVVIALLILGPIATFFVMYQFATVPDPNAVAAVQNQPVTIYYADGSVMTTLDDGARTFIQPNAIPPAIQKAAEAAEDEHFETNAGFDIAAILRSARNQLGGGVGGGSTITQEYIKVATGNNQHSLTRKVNEVVEAYKMNNTYSKSQVLAAYLNTVYFGRGAYGISSAAQIYFNTTPDKLSYSQAALLAGMIQKPGDGNVPSVELSRWQYVMSRLQANNWVTSAYYEANHTSAQFPPTQPYEPGGTSSKLPFDRQLIVQEVENELAGPGIGYSTDAIERTGVKIYTTIQPQAQGDAESSVAGVLSPADDALTDGQQKTIGSGSKATTVRATEASALVSIDPKTGGIIAWYGGNDPKAASYDLAMTPEDPGSSFKPYVFASGLENDPSQIGLNAIYDGSPDQVLCGQKVGNSEGEGDGQDSVMQAMTQSINTVFYAMGCNIKTSNVAATAYQVGIPKQITNPVTHQTFDTLQNVNSAGKGTGTIEGGISIGQYPVRPLDQAQGYATLANGGMKITAHFVSQMTDNSGKLLYRFQPNPTPAFGAQSAAIAATVVQSMSQVAGYSHDALSGNRPVAAKTGTVQWLTTNHNSEAWMVGFTPQVATAVWFGNRDTPGPIIGNYKNTTGSAHDYDVFGREEPGYIWKAYMDSYLKGQPVVQFPDVATIGGSFNFVTGQDDSTSATGGDSTDSNQSSQTTMTTTPQTTTPGFPGFPPSDEPTTTRRHGGGGSTTETPCLGLACTPDTGGPGGGGGGGGNNNGGLDPGGTGG